MPVPSWNYRLLLILLVSAALRIGLAVDGGQFFFGDENRHERGVALYHALRTGDTAGIKAALMRPEHIGFTLIGAGITGLQHLTAQFTGQGDWHQPENVIFTMPLAAAWLALFSALNIGLLHAVARRAGADGNEAAWAALLMAASNTGLYFSRHFLPYDAAMSAMLAALWAGARGRHSLATGALAGIAYHIYNGYWYLVPVVLTLHALAKDHGQPAASRLRRLLVAGTGSAVVVALPVLIGFALTGPDYWQTMVAFSGTVNQGLYAEGWSLPWEYLGHSEGLLGGAVLLAIVAAALVARRAGEAPGRLAQIGLLGVALAYVWLVLFSVGLGKFVVYARTVKPFIPFLGLAGGWALARLLAGRPQLAAAATAAICLMAALQFAPHFGRIFPAEAEVRILREFGNPKRSLAVSGSLYTPLALPVQRPELILVNAQMLYPVRSYLGYPAGHTIVSLEHPLSYPPFQYECHNPRERALLRENDIRLRLIRLSAPDDIPDDPPPSLRFTAADRPDGRRN